jgi:hypothetical protein
MLDFEVHARGRKCAKTDRLFEPGEEFYSVLVSEGANVVRYDYAADAWEGPPEKAVGWWKSQVPDTASRKMHWAPNDVMLNYFEQIADNPDKQDVRYVLTLLMIRRRVLKLEEADEQSTEETEEISVYCPKNEQTYKVPVASPPAERVEAIQNELAELLFGKN